MPVETPQVPGDIPFPQYSVTDSEFLKNAVPSTKGNIMTLDAAGRLIAVVGAVAIADLTRGGMQATVTRVAPTAEDTDEIQLLKQRSRIILKADVNLSPGDEVELKCVAGVVTPDKVQLAAVAGRTDGYLGRIFQVYTLGTDGVKKQFTADDDLVIVDLEA